MTLFEQALGLCPSLYFAPSVAEARVHRDHLDLGDTPESTEWIWQACVRLLFSAAIPPSFIPMVYAYLYDGVRLRLRTGTRVYPSHANVQMGEVATVPHSPRVRNEA